MDDSDSDSGGREGASREPGCASPLVSDGGRRFDEVFRALADQYRRYALYYLRDEERAPLTDVAEQIAAWERDCSVDAVPESACADVETSLYHHHLPRLREGGIIEYDERSRALVFRDPPDLVELCLEHCAPRELA